MKQTYILFISLILLSCNSPEKKIAIDQSKHIGLIELESNQAFKILYSSGQINHARKQTALIDEAYKFLSEIMGAKKDFCLLVLKGKDWEKNAYSLVAGMPEYYKGNLIVGAGQNDMASGYGGMIRNLPEEMTNDLIKTYTNELGEFDMSLFFDKLSIHELTHNFQDPKNQEGYSISRWLEELHANMGLYAFYKSERPNDLKYIKTLVDFSIDNPPPNIKYHSLSDFDTHYYEIGPENYGFYQMKLTKTGQKVIDSLGNSILKQLNDFLIKYDESWKDKITEEEFRKKLAIEVDPYLVQLIDTW